MQTADQTLILDNLSESSEEFEAAINGVPPGLWLQRPEGSDWSPSECAEHVVIVEGRLQKRIAALEQTPAEAFDPDQSRRKDETVMNVAKREQRFKAPEMVMPKGVYTDAATLLAAFRETRARSIELANHYPEWMRGRFAEHPVLNKLDGHQWMLAIASHSRRHAAQIREMVQQLGS